MKGKLYISKFQNTRDARSVVLDIEDVSSGTRFLTVHISLEDFSLALFGLADVEIEFELHTEYVGKISQHKSENIPIPAFQPSDEQIDYLCSIYEQDGWIARRSDFKNHHNITHKSDGTYVCHVIFNRFVDPE